MNRKDHIKPLTVGFLTPFYDSIIKIISFEKFYQKIALALNALFLRRAGFN